jgi:hypothetical protein
MIDNLIIPLAGIALPAVIVPTILAFRHSAKKREYEHLERMKALETGQPVPGESQLAAATTCVAIGAGVPIGAFFFTLIASLSSPNMADEVWIAPVVVSGIALMSSLSLARSLFRPKAPANSTIADAHLNGKPSFDPDAYDVAGSRG